MATVTTPSVLWAQRSSCDIKENNFIYLTVVVPEFIPSTLNYTVTDRNIYFEIEARGDERRRYTFELEFHANVDPVLTKTEISTDENVVNFVIFKTDISFGHWPQLSNVSLDYVRPDISQEINEEGEQSGVMIVKWVKRLKSLVREISRHRKAQRTITTVQTRRLEWLFRMGNSYFSRYEQSADLVDIECATSHFQQAVQLTPIGHADRFAHLSGLGNALTCRFEHTGNLADIDSAISHLQQALHLIPAGHVNHIACLSNLGNAFTSRFNHKGDLADVDSAIYHQQQAVDLIPAGHANRPSCLHNLANSFRCRFQHSGDITDIERAISHLQQAMKIIPTGHAHRPVCMNNLGNSFRYRFERFGDIDDINVSIFNLREAVNVTPAGHTDLPSYLDNLASSLRGRFKHKGDLADINSAITNQQRAVDLTPSTSRAGLASRLNNLGNAFTSRFQRTGNLSDIDSAISHLQKAVDLTPAGHTILSSRLNNLGNSFRCHFQHTGDLSDIDSAISHQQRAVDLTPAGHSSLPSCLDNLANSFRCRFEYTEDQADIECAISHLQQAVKLTPTGHTSLPSQLNNLANCFTRRFECIGDLDDIDSAISHLQQAVDLTPAGHASLPVRLNNLGSSLTSRFEHTGNLIDIDTAISHLTQAVESTPADHTFIPACLNNLAKSLRCRFEHTEDLDDIDRAISFLKRVVKLTPEDHANLPSRLNHLGGSYCRRFERSGDLVDLDFSISHLQQAVHLTPANHADLSSRLNNLGNSFIRRFKHMDDIADINFAISHLQEAVRLTPAGHVDLPATLNNLGNSFRCRFDHTGDLTDINSAISHLQEAVHLTPASDAKLPSRFNNLGNTFTRRFEHLEDLEDIDSAISYQQQAVDLTPADHANRPSFLNNLGGSYLHRFEQSFNLADIDASISHRLHAVSLTPVGHAGLAPRLKNLASSFASRFEQTANSDDLEHAISTYRRGAQASGAPFERLQCAKHAATLSRDVDITSSIPDFGLAISLLAEVAGLEQTIRRRHHTLFEHSAFVSDAVAAALETSSLEHALEWLEQGRCLVWNQIDQLRTPVDRLREENPVLADKFTHVANMLESFGTRSDYTNGSVSIEITDAIRIQDDTLLHTRTAAEYKQTLNAIRGLSSFQDFLRPAKAASILAGIPADGAVVLFNIHTERCDALALMKGADSPVHIPLHGFSYQLAKALQETVHSDIVDHRAARDQTRGAVDDAECSIVLVLEVLWYKVVKPVLDALAYTVPEKKEDRSRIWWCPSGPLLFLPLHAAGVYNSKTQPCIEVSDYVVSSYTPTAHSLMEKISYSRTSPTSLLLVSQPNTPGLPTIPSTRQETHAIKRMMEASGFNTLLLADANATQERVRAELNTHTWAHFACHGVQDPTQPLASSLCLHDGRLQLLEIIQQRLTPHADFAFLSACQTGTGDVTLAEEVVHLAAAMLGAGYRGVVGTMWNISDEHAPLFAERFYEFLVGKKELAAGLESAWAAWALDYATREVRKGLGSGGAAFLTWVPYVHFGY